MRDSVLSGGRRRYLILPIALVISTSLAGDALGGPPEYDFLQFGGDPQHSGDNTKESILSPANVASLTRTFHVSLPAVADGAPVLLTSVSTTSGTHDLLFVTTKAGHILALDAHTGTTVWTHQNGPGTCHVNNGSTACFTTSSPAIDPARTYVYSYGLDGYAHKYAVGTGTEVTTGGWPELASNKPFDEKASSPLATATASNGTSYLYVAAGGYPGDNGDYQGHVTIVDLADGSQRVFNTLCSDQSVHFVETPGTPDCSVERSAVWARAAVVYDADNNKIFFGTGNGNFVPSSHQWGDSVLALNPDGTGSGTDPIDSYTPSTFATLESGDVDLGSTAPAILHVPSNSNVSHLAVQGGKDALLRLINLDNLSGQGGIGHTDGNVGAAISVPQGGGVFSAPAVWTNPADGSAWAFVANGSGISALRLTIDGSGNPSLTTVWQNSSGGTSPIVANGVLYYASSGLIRGLQPTTGSVLWQDTEIGGIHWESPIVANGNVYITDESGFISAYGGVTAPAAPALPAPGLLLLALTLLVTGTSVAGRALSAGAPTSRAS